MRSAAGPALSDAGSVPYPSGLRVHGEAADAVMEASWPGWSDTGALMLVALAVILALTESQKQKIHNR